MSKTIYLLQGNTGEYSDYQDWIIACYTNKKEAEKHLKLLQEEVKEKEKTALYRHNIKTKYDPNISIDYTGVFYNVIEFETVDSLKEFLKNNQNESALD